MIDVHSNFTLLAFLCASRSIIEIFNVHAIQWIDIIAERYYRPFNLSSINPTFDFAEKCARFSALPVLQNLLENTQALNTCKQ